MKYCFFRKQLRVKGFFDGIFNGHACGWVFRSDQPGLALQVDVLYDNEAVASGRADLFREDLPTVGIGDGRHAFRIPLDTTGRHPILYQVQETSTGTILKPSAPSLDGQPFDCVPADYCLAMLKSVPTGQGKSPNTVKNATATFQKVCQAQKTGDLPRAYGLLQELAGWLQDNALILCKLGELNVKRGAWKEALEFYRKAAGLDMQCYWAHVGMGYSLFKLDNLEAAADAYKIALGIRQGNKPIADWIDEAQRKLAPVQAERLLLSNNDEAFAILAKCLLDDPDNAALAQKAINICCQQHSAGTIACCLNTVSVDTSRRLLESVIIEIESRALNQ